MCELSDLLNVSFLDLAKVVTARACGLQRTALDDLPLVLTASSRALTPSSTPYTTCRSAARFVSWPVATTTSPVCSPNSKRRYGTSFEKPSGS